MLAVRKRSELLTTVTDESAIAPAASTGESSHPVKGYSSPAATGMSATLYTNAQNRFCRMVATVRRAKRPWVRQRPR